MSEPALTFRQAGSMRRRCATPTARMREPARPVVGMLPDGDPAPGGKRPDHLDRRSLSPA